MISYRLSCCAGSSATVPYRLGGSGWRGGYRPLPSGVVGWGGRVTAPYRPICATSHSHIVSLKVAFVLASRSSQEPAFCKPFDRGTVDPATEQRRQHTTHVDQS